MMVVKVVYSGSFVELYPLAKQYRLARNPAKHRQNHFIHPNVRLENYWINFILNYGVSEVGSAFFCRLKSYPVEPYNPRLSQARQWDPKEQNLVLPPVTWRSKTLCRCANLLWPNITVEMVTLFFCFRVGPDSIFGPHSQPLQTIVEIS